MINELTLSKKTIFSFEVFPPKKTMPIDSVFSTLDELKDLNPDFISVTFGAGGSENCDNSIAIAKRIKDVCHVEPVIHMPCLNMTRADAKFVLEQFKQAGIDNILALRGDKVEGKTPCGDFKHADELIRFIKDFDNEHPEKTSFNILGACYPELHPESSSVYDDIDFLKQKVDAGATHLLSQLFFDNDQFYRFLERCKIKGINVPIEAGIMPVTNKKSIERMVSLTNAKLPKKFTDMMARYEAFPEAIRDAGIAYAIDQIVDLVTHGVQGIHLYTMNNPHIARKIYEATKSLFDVAPIISER
ncbi:MAG: methylenetetrahydrofolate reductase [NAD(P)H] [Treponema sp.]|nr:methylenetetrahydrofolate reductase [NAD(P)H] [Treponema sp.]